MKEREFINQIKSRERFEFGKNWSSFLQNLSENQIQVAESSLAEMIPIKDLTNKTFLDMGCGSGIFSLAAKRLNAQVYSVDFDPASVGCANHLKEKFFPEAENWKIQEGSVLDYNYMLGLPKFDIVYSWGVLHHTGNMLLALENITIPVKENGILFIAIYNDQGWKSKLWLKIKKFYNSSIIGKITVTAIFYSYFASIGFFIDTLTLNNPTKRYREYKRKRGMSMIHDWKDWLGGLPFEVATPEMVFNFYSTRGFKLEKIKTTNSAGNNQFVFRKTE